MRIALGLIAATCATPVAITIVFSALYSLQVGGSEGQSWGLVADNIRLYGVFSMPIAFFVTMAFGGPLAHRLAHLGHLGVGRHAMVGVILGAAPFLLFDGYIIGSELLLNARPAPDIESVMSAGRWAALGSWCGLWSACVYWLVVIRPGGSGANAVGQTRPESPPSPEP